VSIHYIRKIDINYILWDRCINNSLNGLVYSLSWYLDIVAENWDALVEDDYRSVMPLVYSKRSIYRHIYSPVLVKQLGIFSVKPLTEAKIDQFVKLIPNTFKKIEICFNRQNFQSVHLENNCSVSKTFEMDLIISYEKKSKFYSPDVKNCLDIANKSKLHAVKGVSISELESFIIQYTKRKTGNLIIKLVNSGRVELIGVYNTTNMLISIACFIRSNQNVILLYALTNNQGVEEKANYLILDSFLKSYSSRNITLCLDHIDESWDLQFYRDYGAQESCYLRLKENRMPFFLKWV